MTQSWEKAHPTVAKFFSCRVPFGRVRAVRVAFGAIALTICLFTVVFVLGKRAVSAAQKSGLPEEVKAAIEDAREYVEGRSIRLDVRTVEDVAIVKQIITIKMDN